MVQSIKGLEALSGEWDALAGRFGSPLLEHDWFLSCAEAFHRDGDLRVTTVFDGDRLVGVAPLARDSTKAGSHLKLLGVSRLYEPSGWLFASDDALRELVERTVGLRTPMLLQRIPADSVLCRVLPEWPSHRAIVIARPTASSLAVSTREPWEAYFRQLSTRITENLRRVRRKAERTFGSVQLAQVEPGPADVDALLETVVAVEGSGWKGRNRSSIGAQRDLLMFFQHYCRRAAARRRLRVTTLHFGARIAAVELSVEAHNRAWQLKIGYDEAVASYYPGLLLCEGSIRSAFERGLDAYEFLGSAAAWEERWRPDVRSYMSLAVYPISPHGLLGGCRDLAALVWARAEHAWSSVPRRGQP